MRSFKKYIAEVAEPRERGAHEEQAFKDQHVYEVIPHPVALDTQFNGEINAPSAARPADQKGDAAYDQAYSKGVFEESAEEAVSEALSPKQKEIDHDNDGDIDGKDLAALRAKKKNKSTTKQEDADLEEKVTHSPKHVKMAIGIASDKRYKGGNMTGAIKAMNKMKPGISDHPQVAAVLKRQNESLDEGILKNISNKIKGPLVKKELKKNIDHHKEQSSAHNMKSGEVKVIQHGMKMRPDNAKAIKHHDKMKDHHATAAKHLGAALKSHEAGNHADHDKHMKSYDNHTKNTKHKTIKTIDEVTETTMSAVKKPVTMTGPDGKTRTVMKTTKVKNSDDSGQDKIITNESINAQLEENMKFKMGNLRLKNGKSVKVSKQDSDLLNQMFKDLSATNRRKLGAVAMKDEAGFEEIRGFAREAL